MTMNRFINWMLIPLLALTVSLIPFQKAIAQPGLFSPNASPQELIDEVNALRLSNDLPPYIRNPILMEIAQRHANYLAANALLTHFGEGGSRPHQRALDAGYAVAGDLSTGGLLAENIHSASNLSAAGVVTFWQSDTVTADAMLSSEFEDIGIGEAAQNGVTYYVLLAGKEGEAQRAATPTATLSSLEFVIATAGGFGTPAIVVSRSTPLENGEIFHIVKKNEGLWSIALAYNTTVEQLKLLNGLATDEIFEGQNLLVFRPVPDTATPTPAATATMGIPTSTPTIPITPTVTSTPTPVPTPPASRESGQVVVGSIVLIALLAAAIGAWLGKKKPEKAVD